MISNLAEKLSFITKQNSTLRSLFIHLLLNHLIFNKQLIIQGYFILLGPYVLNLFVLYILKICGCNKYVNKIKRKSNLWKD